MQNENLEKLDFDQLSNLEDQETASQQSSEKNDLEIQDLVNKYQEETIFFIQNYKMKAGETKAQQEEQLFKFLEQIEKDQKQRYKEILREYRRVKRQEEREMKEKIKQEKEQQKQEKLQEKELRALQKEQEKLQKKFEKEQEKARKEIEKQMKKKGKCVQEAFEDDDKAKEIQFIQTHF